MNLEAAYELTTAPELQPTNDSRLPTELSQDWYIKSLVNQKIILRESGKQKRRERQLNQFKDKYFR